MRLAVPEISGLAFELLTISVQSWVEFRIHLDSSMEGLYPALSRD